MGKVEKSIEIKAPREKVWEMLALDRLQEWQEGSLPTKGMEFTSEVSTPEDKFGVGASAHPSAQPEVDFKVTESLENEKIAYLVEEPQMSATITSVLEPIEEGTELTYAVDYEMPWGILGKFLEKLFMKRMGEREIERSLENLKNILER